MKTTTFFSYYPHACSRAKKWAKQYNTMSEAWEACERGDWMLWALRAMGYSNESKLRKCACRFARMNWDVLADERSRTAIEVAERYADGNATDEELSAAGSAADAAAWSAAGSAADAAAWSAVRSAWYAAAWSAAGSAADAAAWSAAWSEQADIIREIIGNPFSQ